MKQNPQSDPRILLTTSRNPSRRTRTLIKDLTWVLPKAARVSRGTKNIYELAVLTLAARAPLLIVVSTRKGNPGKINFFRVTEQTYSQLPLELVLAGVKLRSEISRQHASRSDDLFILPAGSLSPRGRRLCESLSNIFMIPLIDKPKKTGKPSMIMRIEEQNKIHITFAQDMLAKEVGPQLRIGKVNFFERPPI